MTEPQQVCLWPEGSDEYPSALHRAQMMDPALTWIGDIAGIEVSHYVVLGVDSNLLRGVEPRDAEHQGLRSDRAALKDESASGA